MEKKRFKLSGAQFRRKSKEEAEKRVKDEGALLKYFETSATSQDGKLSTFAATQDSTEIVFEPSDPAGKPSTSTALHRPVSPQLQSDPEDDGPFASTASHQDSLELPGAELTTEDGSLSTDPGNWPSFLSQRIKTIDFQRTDPIII